MTYYKLWSINLLRFIKAHGIRPISKGIHPNTNRQFWVFEVTEELSAVLQAWTNNKKEKDFKMQKEKEAI